MVDVADFALERELIERDARINDDLDLTFLDVIDQEEEFFAINRDYYDALARIASRPAFTPSLHENVFREPLQHAVWTSQSWPQTSRHFPA